MLDWEKHKPRPTSRMYNQAEHVQLAVHDLAHDETDSLTDPTLLAEILEAREELEYAETQEEVDELRAANQG